MLSREVFKGEARKLQGKVALERPQKLRNFNEVELNGQACLSPRHRMSPHLCVATAALKEGALRVDSSEQPTATPVLFVLFCLGLVLGLEEVCNLPACAAHLPKAVLPIGLCVHKTRIFLVRQKGRHRRDSARVSIQVIDIKSDG